VSADIGQGVNSALLDVSTLLGCIEKCPNDLTAALREYETIRLAENEALVRIMQV
jgi:2-polyprenyl-6-methoxyphenol hydroxylase-like FAD-dependent oxidoreductase